MLLAFAFQVSTSASTCLPLAIRMQLYCLQASLQDTAFRDACALPMAALKIVMTDVLVLCHLLHKALREFVSCLCVELTTTSVRAKMNVLCSRVLKHFFNASELGCLPSSETKQCVFTETFPPASFGIAQAHAQLSVVVGPVPALRLI